MLKMIFPDAWISSVYEVDFHKLYEMGYRGIIFDVDNTLVGHNIPADEKAKQFFQELELIGFKTIVVSNNEEPRVKKFCYDVKATGYVFKAQKPRRKGYKQAMKLMQTKKRETVFFGDQIFTDTLGARRTNILAIKVEPVVKWEEDVQIVLKRLLEEAVYFFYKIEKKINGERFQIPIKSEENEW